MEVVIMKWEYVPIFGLIKTFVAHRKAVKAFLKTPREGSYDATWEAADKCTVAIICTFGPMMVLVVVVGILCG